MDIFLPCRIIKCLKVYAFETKSEDENKSSKHILVKCLEIDCHINGDKIKPMRMTFDV